MTSHPPPPSAQQSTMDLSMMNLSGCSMSPSTNHSNPPPPSAQQRTIDTSMIDMSGCTSNDSLNPFKRRRTNLLSTMRVRNGGSETSFLTTSTPGLTSANDSRSDTEEEDNAEDVAQEYLDMMTDDTDRPTQTVFGRGVDVWKSFNGTVYADLNDKMKKKQRDEEIWGKKRKRGGHPQAQEQEQVQETVYSDSLRRAQDGSVQDYTDGNITYPALLATAYPSFIPPSPTASMWEASLNVEASISQSMMRPETLPPPMEYRPRVIKPLPARARGTGRTTADVPRGAEGGHGPTEHAAEERGLGPYGSMEGFQPTEDIHTAPTHTTMQGFQHTEDRHVPPTRTATHPLQRTDNLPAHPSSNTSTAQHTTNPQPTAPRRLLSDFPLPTHRAVPTTPGFFGNVFAFAQHMLSDSFGSHGRDEERLAALGQNAAIGTGGAGPTVPDSFGGLGRGSDVDRFDEHPYRLGQAGDAAGTGGGNKESGGRKGKLNPLKGRPWLSRK